MTPSRNRRRLAAAGALSAALSGCGGDASPVPANASDAVKNYARIVLASYEDSAAASRMLATEIEGFLRSPTPDGLSRARMAWLAAREPYLQTEVYRFYDGPIDTPMGGPEGLLNAWPLDEAYIDYVEGKPSSGIINDPGKAITAAALEALNEQGGEENVSTGYHAIEFLLWGQDLSPDAPGQRPHTDYLTGDGATAANPDRRKLYLSTVTTMLVGHLQGLVDAWAPTARYRVEMERAPAAEGLRRILTGMIILSGFETGGERLQTALDSGDQEDEHSCFSDNTHRDMIQNIQGVQNVYRGRYRRSDGSEVVGTGIRDVVAALDTALSARLDDEIAQSLALARALMPPFDREIAFDNAAGRARVQALVRALRKQETTLQEVFRKLGLSIPPPPM